MTTSTVPVGASSSESVRVIVRCRPSNSREKQLKSKEVVQINPSTLQCSLLSEEDPKTFTFDGVYDQTSTTEQIYTDFGYPLVEGVMEGYNATVFAYGQTGSGKSFTMQGVTSPASQLGILPRAFEHLFECIATAQGTKYLVFASYLEIYNEDIRDLLSPDYKRKLELKENPDKGVFVAGLSQHPVHCVNDCQVLMENGWKNRSVGATLMNADSSRSHSLFSISVEMLDLTGIGDQSIRRGKLNLVDLAGSERQSKTGATGDRLKEATKINLSLSALGNVISALVDGKSKHIPYRDSKLTRLLQDSLGGNTKTLMIACISPADDNYDETLSTLRYANRAKNIQNRPRINQDPKDAMLREYQQEIERLSKMVELNKNGSTENAKLSVEAELERERAQLRTEYEEKIRNLQLAVEREQESNAKANAEMENLKRSYQDELQKINATSMKKKVELDEEAQETLKKLKQIEGDLVGGEKANDREFQERHWKRKNQSERRRALLAQLLARAEDDDGALLRVYDDIQEEVRVKTDAIKKYRQKVKSLDREIQDLQSEFETERYEYLETIRRQDQQLKLLQQVLAKIHPLLRKDTNYSDLDAIKQQSLWMDEYQRWKLPELCFTRVKLPPTGMNGTYHDHYETVNEAVDEGDYGNGDRLLQKLQRSEAENLAGRYFASNRANEIVIRANKDLNRSRQKIEVIRPGMKGAALSQSHSSLQSLAASSNPMTINSNGSNGSGGDVVFSSLQVGLGPLSTSWSAPNSLSNSWNPEASISPITNNHKSSSMMRKPKKLESLNVGTTYTTSMNGRTDKMTIAPIITTNNNNDLSLVTM